MPSYYNSFLHNTVAPVDQWKTHTQELLNEDFINSSNLIQIEEETSFGSLQFEPIMARVTSTLDSKVGDKINDDYRTLLFNNIDYKPPLGKRFRFFDNIWIVYNSENVNSLNSSCYVRRCNNTINTLDFYGNVHREPCVIDIKPTKSSFIEDEEMWTVSTRQVIMYQVNEWTKDINYNTRIMYENQTYRVGVNLNFNRLSTFDNDSITFAKAYLDLDLVNEFDNTELQIADYSPPEINILLPEKIECYPNSSGVVSHTITRNGEEIYPDLKWYSSNPDVVEINELTGEYHTLSEGEATITTKLSANESYQNSFVIAVTQSPQAIYKTVVYPEDYYIPIGQSKTYTVTEFMGDEPQTTEFAFEVQGIPQKYYQYEVQGNSIVIKCKSQNTDSLLNVIIRNLRTDEITNLYIEMGGLF